MISDRKNILIKGYVVASGLLLIALTVVYSLFNIQLGKNETSKEIADNSFRVKTEPSERGNLYASDDILLSTTVTMHNIFLDLKVVDSTLFYSNINTLDDSLCAMFKYRPKGYFKKKLIREKKKENQYMLLVKNLNYIEYQRIKGFPIFSEGQNKGGFIHQTELKRIITMKDVGARTIGWDNEKGKAGLEGAYSHYLSGVDGRRVEQFMGQGNWKPLSTWEQEPQPGADVYTTIDVGIQNATYRALSNQMYRYEAEMGCAIVMEVATGKVRALVNLSRLKDGTLADIKNYAVGRRYEPGSTMKLPALMVGFEDDKFNLNTFINTGDGLLDYHGKKVKDEHPLGSASVLKIFEQSSNVGMVKLISSQYNSNPALFYEKLDNWYLTKALGVDIPGEPKPIFPDHQSKYWNRYALPWMAQGYGIELTPLQVLNFYNAVANDGVLLKPLFIEKITRHGQLEKEFRPTVLNEKIAKPETIEMARKMLRQVITDGTADHINLEHIALAGKTGTSVFEYWKKSTAKEYVASFAGFYPFDKPIYSAIVVIFKPNKDIGYYGSEVAAPVFRDIASLTFGRTPKEVKIPKENKKEALLNKVAKSKKVEISDTRLMPNVTGVSGKIAIPQLENLGLDVQFKGVGKVREQSIPSGKRIHKGETVYLYLD